MCPQLIRYLLGRSNYAQPEGMRICCDALDLQACVGEQLAPLPFGALRRGKLHHHGEISLRHVPFDIRVWNDYLVQQDGRLLTHSIGNVL